MYGGGSSEEYLCSLDVVKKFQIATKVFPSARTPGVKGWKTYDHTSTGIQSAIEDSFKALGMEKVDLYYLHAPDREVELEETLRLMSCISWVNLIDLGFRIIKLRKLKRL